MYKDLINIFILETWKPYTLKSSGFGKRNLQVIA